MCLLVIGWQVHPRFSVVVVANRDEFHERAAAALGKWAPPDDFIAGRDLRAGGTWLGIDRRRRLGVVTNFRELQRPAPNTPSRGHLIPDFLRGSADSGTQIRSLALRGAEYSGFNLLLADTSALWYGCNRAEPFGRALAPGIYGLSNEFLDTPWPKLRRVRTHFDQWVAEAKVDPESLFAMLSDRAPAGSDDELPRTGLSIEWERALSSPFVAHSEYGTRCS